VYFKFKTLLIFSISGSFVNGERASRKGEGFIFPSGIRSFHPNFLNLIFLRSQTY